jgi:peptidyl-prolyl cis-trans isomerase B (cyclophilin B)
MRKFAALTVFVLVITILSCSKKEKPMESEFDRFSPLNDQQVTELLKKAKSESTAEAVDPQKSLTKEEIDNILATVAATQVEQVGEDEVAIIETSVGTIVLAFYTDEAPEHSKGFKRLVTSGFYTGTRFHRIIDGFVVQGGDILTRDGNPDNDGTGGPGYNLPAEFNGIPHDLGIISMARSQDPNSGGSQFFICLSRQGTQALDGKYTVFAKAIGGMDVVQKLGKTPTATNKYGEKSTPLEPVYINSAYMVTR